MNTLYNIITQKDICIDGHSHLFDSDEIITNEINNDFDKIVGFIDIEPKYIDKYKDVSKLYENFIKKYYDENKHILLVSGTSIEDIKTTYNNHPNIYKGFGEIKCYDYFKGEKIGIKGIKMIKEVCEFSSSVGNLPVYIHYSLTRNEYVKKLKSVLKKYPEVPIVLCHCGMEEKYNYINNIIQYDNDDIYRIVVELMKQYSNLWVDLTFTSAKFFTGKPFLIYNLDLDRIIIGTDLNPVIFKKENKINIYKGYYNILSNYCNNVKNISNLFSIKI